jgi:diketogulonate reductase-like aldo/keto reductase
VAVIELGLMINHSFVGTQILDFKERILTRTRVSIFGIGKLAEKRRCTPAQLALAWILHQGDDVVPIPGERLFQPHSPSIFCMYCFEIFSSIL